MKIVGVIPARLESTRLSRKLLRDLCGKPLIQHVYENVKQSKRLSDVVVACDDVLLEEAVRSFGGKAILTSKNHQSGTERIQEAAGKIPADIYINIQGDEPLMSAENVDLLASELAGRSANWVGTLSVRKNSESEFVNKNVVKVVTDQNGLALYFSRSPIPCYRDGGRAEFFKHLGIYAYRKEFWATYSAMKPSRLEEAEKLEQLKFLENGISIAVFEARHDSVGVDTEEDLENVKQKLMNASSLSLEKGEGRVRVWSPSPSCEGEGKKLWKGTGHA
ncbi:MAG: 3-deoxy-manno-octulosonate cytidylyltransferase [Candidatus Omnitrophica bacterium]|nr:3-deoxy-manno-octulosonate cytidylyltransferase [Candidatus Omnitrophota bacterium]